MKKLNDIGFKRTPQRLAILKYLEGNTEHPSAEDVYKAVSTNFPSMSLATVYKTLDTLAGKGRVLELKIDPDKKRFDPNATPHHHLICICCKKIVDIQEEFKLELTEEVTEKFEVMGNHIEFYGICPGCRGKKNVLNKGGSPCALNIG
jgi:Fur family peroxide stress response transcriptional regulator